MSPNNINLQDLRPLNVLPRQGARGHKLLILTVACAQVWTTMQRTLTVAKHDRIRVATLPFVATEFARKVVLYMLTEDFAA